MCLKSELVQRGYGVHVFVFSVMCICDCVCVCDRYRITHLPFSTQGLARISSGFRNGSSQTQPSIHFTSSVTVMEDFSLLIAS